MSRQMNENYQRQQGGNKPCGRMRRLVRWDRPLEACEGREPLRLPISRWPFPDGQPCRPHSTPSSALGRPRLETRARGFCRVNFQAFFKMDASGDPEP